ncbi:hypothetical protein HK099_002698, partial [Clydaea vesicula]
MKLPSNISFGWKSLLIIVFLFTLLCWNLSLQDVEDEIRKSERDAYFKKLLDLKEENQQEILLDKTLLQNLTEQFVIGQNVLQPTKVTPYFFKMSNNIKIEKHTVTVATLITVDRLPILLNSMKTFDGLYSATLHILSDDNLTTNLITVKSFIKENFNVLKDRLDIHLIIDEYPRQFNFFRNVARYFSRTDLILSLDVDFIINIDFSKNLQDSPQVLEKLLVGSSVFILPAFEFKNGLNKPYTMFPKNKQEIKKHWINRDIIIFHGNLNKGHVSTKYRTWIKKTVPYKIQARSYKYEPYAIFNKHTVPWCDERFTGYGNNKAAWWYEIYLAGIDFYVLPFDFVFHQYHEYDNKVRYSERRKNTSKFKQFSKEICDKYKALFGSENDR